MKQLRKYAPRLSIKFYIIISLISVVLGAVHAQTKIQVVSKTIEKEIDYREGMSLNISAQKADVRVMGWNRPVVSFKLRLVAKHPERKVAEKELVFMLYTIKTNLQFEAENRFKVPQSYGEVESNLKAYYEVFVPFRCPVIITNTFGETFTAQLQASLKVSSEFGKITLENLAGRLDIESHYADIEGDKLNVTLNGRLENANVNLIDLGGNGQLQSKYGKLRIVPNNDLNHLKINAARTEVVVEPRSMDDFTFDVETVFSKINVPNTHQDRLKKTLNKYVFDFQTKNRRGTIVIRNSYSPILIEPTRNTAAKRD